MRYDYEVIVFVQKRNYIVYNNRWPEQLKIKWSLLRGWNAFWFVPPQKQIFEQLTVICIFLFNERHFWLEKHCISVATSFGRFNKFMYFIRPVWIIKIVLVDLCIPQQNKKEVLEDCKMGIHLLLRPNSQVLDIVS
jgi:hypothetical protein